MKSNMSESAKAFKKTTLDNKGRTVRFIAKSAATKRRKMCGCINKSHTDRFERLVLF